MNHDFVELLAGFNAKAVEYMVVGAHALAAHGHVRATKDLDIWIHPSRENAVRVLAALSEFGAPLHDLSLADLAVPGVVFQIGVAPVRIDVITSIDGVVFSDAWPDRVISRFGGESVPVLSRAHLIVNKKSSGRLQDLADVERLENSEPHPGHGSGSPD
ncbi:MAG: hypothetical protein V3W41_17870 [Planctomycetota bacterium]